MMCFVFGSARALLLLNSKSCMKFTKQNVFYGSYCKSVIVNINILWYLLKILISQKLFIDIMGSKVCDKVYSICDKMKKPNAFLSTCSVVNFFFQNTLAYLFLSPEIELVDTIRTRIGKMRKVRHWSRVLRPVKKIRFGF